MVMEIHHHQQERFGQMGMRNLTKFGMITILIVILSFSVYGLSVKTIFNTFSGKLDYIRGESVLDLSCADNEIVVWNSTGNPNCEVNSATAGQEFNVTTSDGNITITEGSPKTISLSTAFWTWIESLWDADDATVLATAQDNVDTNYTEGLAYADRVNTSARNYAVAQDTAQTIILRDENDANTTEIKSTMRDERDENFTKLDNRIAIVNTTALSITNYTMQDFNDSFYNWSQDKPNYYTKTETNDTIDDKLTGDTWYFYKNYTLYGTANGDIDLTRGNYDSNSLNITELNPQGLEYYANTSNNVTTDVSQICIRYIAMGDNYILYLRKNGDWESYGTIGEVSDFTWHCESIRDADEHVINNTIVIKIEDAGLGRVQHSLKLENMYVSSGYSVQSSSEVDPHWESEKSDYYNKSQVDTHITTNKSDTEEILRDDIDNNRTASDAYTDTRVDSVVNATSSANISVDITTGIVSFNMTCEQITGSASLCDGDDAAGSGGGSETNFNITIFTNATNNWSIREPWLIDMIELYDNDTNTQINNCSVDTSCADITYDTELAYISNCSSTDSCANVVYNGDLTIYQLIVGAYTDINFTAKYATMGYYTTTNHSAETHAYISNCSVDTSCSAITYDNELAYINNCSVSGACSPVAYDTELIANCSGATCTVTNLGTLDGFNGADFEVQLNNEAGLYAVLSDVTNFLQNLVEDLTPQLGGNLDTNTKNITNIGGGKIWGNASCTVIEGDDGSQLKTGSAC